MYCNLNSYDGTSVTDGNKQIKYKCSKWNGKNIGETCLTPDECDPKVTLSNRPTCCIYLNGTRTCADKALHGIIGKIT